MISFALNESLAGRYGGASSKQMVKKAFNFSVVSEALEARPKEPIETECSVVFSDISGFSARVADLEPKDIKEYLDDYYAAVIPIIYKHGGLIDQMIGDGIISVFSKDLSPEVTGSVFDAGLSSAEEIVKHFAGDHDYSTKCALHKDRAVICQIGDENYQQATVIGSIMTIVHRVESVAVDEAVSMLLAIPEAHSMEFKVGRETARRNEQGIRTKIYWDLRRIDAELKGVGRGPQKILVEKYVGG